LPHTIIFETTKSCPTLYVSCLDWQDKNEWIAKVEECLNHVELGNECDTARFESEVIAHPVTDELLDLRETAEGRVFEPIEMMGRGHFAKVYKARNMDTGEVIAMKCFKKDAMNDLEFRLCREEYNVLKDIQHPNIIKIGQFFTTSKHIVMTMDLCEGGELTNWIAKRAKFSEDDYRGIVRGLLETINFLHSEPHHVVHRDLKLSNILLQDSSPESNFKVIDFGLAAVDRDENMLTLYCGTVDYMAPEILKKADDRHYGKGVDVWALGVIVYVLLSGLLPFNDKDDKEVIRKILKHDLIFPEKEWCFVSPLAQEFVGCMLNPDPDKRQTAKELLDHEWLNVATEVGQENLPSLQKHRSTHNLLAEQQIDSWPSRRDEIE